IQTARVERVNSHRVTQYVDVAVALGESLSERFPFVPAFSTAVDSEFAVGGIVFRVALDRDDIDRLRVMGVNCDRKSEICRQVTTYLLPRFTCIIAPHHIPMLLHE